MRELRAYLETIDAQASRFTLENPSHNKHMSSVILTQGRSCDLQKWIDYNGLQVQ